MVAVHGSRYCSNGVAYKKGIAKPCYEQGTAGGGVSSPIGPTQKLPSGTLEPGAGKSSPVLH